MLKTIKYNGTENLNDIIFRRATVDDAQKIIDYCNKIGKESDNMTYRDYYFDKVEDQIGYIEKYYNHDENIYIIAELNGKMIGNIQFFTSGRGRMKHTGEMGMSVLKEYWGLGIGSSLVKKFLEWTKTQNNLMRIELLVKSDNQRALRLYERFGFEVEGIAEKKFNVDGKLYDMVMLALIL